MQSLAVGTTAFIRHGQSFGNIKNLGSPQNGGFVPSGRSGGYPHEILSTIIGFFTGIIDFIGSIFIIKINNYVIFNAINEFYVYA